MHTTDWLSSYNILYAGICKACEWRSGSSTKAHIQVLGHWRPLLYSTKNPQGKPQAVALLHWPHTSYILPSSHCGPSVYFGCMAVSLSTVSGRSNNHHTDHRWWLQCPHLCTWVDSSELQWCPQYHLKRDSGLFFVSHSVGYPWLFLSSDHCFSCIHRCYSTAEIHYHYILHAFAHLHDQDLSKLLPLYVTHI